MNVNPREPCQPLLEASTSYYRYSSTTTAYCNVYKLSTRSSLHVLRPECTNIICSSRNYRKVCTTYIIVLTIWLVLHLSGLKHVRLLRNTGVLPCVCAPRNPNIGEPSGYEVRLLSCICSIHFVLVLADGTTEG